jgi:hypothetical protein
MTGFLVQGGAPPDGSVTTAKILNDAVTLAKIAAGTDGELITWNASGDPAAVAVGTATHVLTSNGTGAAPTFQAAGGGLVFLQTTDIGSTPATINFTAVDASKYDAYMCLLLNVTPSNDDVHLYMRTSTDGGSSYDASGGNYDWAVSSEGGSNSAHEATGSPDNVISLTGLNAGGDYTIGSSGGEDGISGVIWVLGPHLVKQTNIVWSLFFDSANPGGHGVTGGALRDSAGDVDAWQWLFEAGTLESGTISVYGVVNG